LAILNSRNASKTKNLKGSPRLRHQTLNTVGGQSKRGMSANEKKTKEQKKQNHPPIGTASHETGKGQIFCKKNKEKYSSAQDAVSWNGNNCRGNRGGRKMQKRPTKRKCSRLSNIYSKRKEREGGKKGKEARGKAREKKQCQTRGSQLIERAERYQGIW